MDHIHQISIDPFNRNGKDNLQGLCAECHLEKTMSQGSTPDHIPMMSYFNEHTWENFVLPERPQQQVYKSGTIDRYEFLRYNLSRCAAPEAGQGQREVREHPIVG